MRAPGLAASSAARSSTLFVTRVSAARARRRCSTAAQSLALRRPGQALAEQRGELSRRELLAGGVPVHVPAADEEVLGAAGAEGLVEVQAGHAQLVEDLLQRARQPRGVPGRVARRIDMDLVARTE